MERRWALLECTRQCAKTANCHAFVMLNNNNCQLARYNLCRDPGTTLYKANLYQTYDLLRPGDVWDNRRTCFGMCGNCNSCGRQNCWGEYCTSCAHACWVDVVANLTGKLVLWKNKIPTNGLNFVCDQGWQKIWKYDQTDAFFAHVTIWDDGPLTLRLVVELTNGTILIGYFSDFTNNGDGSISVGEYTDGDTGNFWQAPFDSRTKSSSESCLSFFYPTTNCSVEGSVAPGYVWGVVASTNGTAPLALPFPDTFYVNYIDLYVMPKHFQNFSTY